MKLNEKLQIELKKLKDFGLNPSDWNVEPLQKKIFRIVHKEDSNFILKGYFDKQAWQRIWLQSI